MKLPRWFVYLLWAWSIQPGLAAATWWWVMWPERTAREFVALAAAGKYEEANKLMLPPARWVIERYVYDTIDADLDQGLPSEGIGYDDGTGEIQDTDGEPVILYSRTFWQQPFCGAWPSAASRPVSELLGGRRC